MIKPSSTVKLLFFFLAFQIQPALAMTNQILYQSCKALVDNGFQRTNDPLHDGVCMGYVKGVYDFAGGNCHAVQTILKTVENNTVWKFTMATFSFDMKKVTAEEAIKKYVIDIEKKPERWEEMPYGEVLKSLISLAPCK